MRRTTTRRKVTLAVVAVAAVAFGIWAAQRISQLDEATQATNPLFRWEYLFSRERTPEELSADVREHLELTVVPVVIGTVLSAALSALILRFRWMRAGVFTFAGVLYTIPSLALFILMPLILGTKILDPVNVIVAMTIYTVALLVRTVVDGLGSVPSHVDAAARAMGLGAFRRLVTVQLPLAVPVIAAGLRVAAVSNVSIVSVASLIGVSQLGDLLVDGYNRDIPGELWAGIVGCLVLALLFDLLIQGLARLLTPWLRADSRSSARRLAPADAPRDVGVAA